MTQVNLFRGQCVGPSVDIIGENVEVTLDVEDYNRLPPILPLGAPNGDNYLAQVDGTSIAIDPRGQLTSLAALFAPFALGGCWPDAAPLIDLVTGFLAPEVPGLPLIDNGTAMTSLRAHVDQLLPRISGATRQWLAPPPSGDGLVLYVVDFSDVAQTALLPAPYEIDSDVADWNTRPLPIRLGPIGWDWAGIRGSVYVRGGTPPPEGSGFATGLGNAHTGTAYVDAPGSITAADKALIGAWRQNRDFVELLTAKATMPAFLGNVTYGGWRVGQTVLVTSAKHSRFAGHELYARPTVIQGVTARMISPGGTLSIAIDGVPLTKPFTWQGLSFGSLLSGAGRCQLRITLLEETDTIEIPELADVWITYDDEADEQPDIEWDLDLGDIPAGALTRELARAVDPPAVAPVYRFVVEVKDPSGVIAGVASPVSAQLSDGAGAAVPLAGVPMEWINPPIQWTNVARTIPGNLLTLADDTGTTDTAGRVFTTLTPSGPLPADYSWEVSAVALPVA